MPELQMDVAVANRFISSLSKSLQALCHGCMDFDTGIEIVGYINVNIDCGSKVDYVLNEKVLKSTTNSMTFVSNSFLAKKDQPKQTRDGTCSPIPELNPPPVSPFQNRSRGYFHGTHPRNIAPVSHSNVQHGAQKRSWAGMERDWRMSPKKQRGGRPFYPSTHESGSASQDTHSNSSSSSHPAADSEFKHPQTSFQGSDASNFDSQSEVNIKKEFLENDTSRETGLNEQDQSQSFDQNPDDSSDPVSGVANIKRDPDASAADVDDETLAADRTVNESDDYKDTFLEPSASEDNQAATENNRTDSGVRDDIRTVSGGSAPEISTEAEENVATGSEMQGDYDEGAEEGAYPQSVYSDTGEGSSDAGQFEVIEIDDEDEDVQAMFGGPLLWYSQQARYRTHSHPGTHGESEGQNQHQPSPARTVSIAHCMHCGQVMPKSVLRHHMLQKHGDQMPYQCSLCGKGFLSHTGLSHHLMAHEGRKFVCPVCDSKFNQKPHLKYHLNNVHKVSQCPACLQTFNIGDEFNKHLLTCS
ncbi:unnamed protein product [Candidula unifasciata]|uniref:C2H2-type domain-containing protein n=1 Tax=Candidula unifasciata TaxID=100452 RepID=A0A8S4A4V1_9EUPU|nr:unnamed protein product [Candidula unifasciata]